MPPAPALSALPQGSQRSGPRWRVAIRIARRQTLRAWSSSLLIIALIALPMMVVSGAIVFGMSRVPTADETITSELGNADAWVSIVHGPDPSLTQAFDSTDEWTVETNDKGPVNAQLPLYPSAAPFLPAGLHPIEIGEGIASVDSASGIASMMTVVGDAGDPALRGRFQLVSGRVATTDAEAMVSPGALTHLGARVGDTLTVNKPAATYTIVGVMKLATSSTRAETLFLPGTPANRALQTEVRSTRWFVPTWSPTVDEAHALNAQGLFVFDRAFYKNPGAYGAEHSSRGGFDGGWAMVALLAGVASFLAYLIVLLAGAAFSVAARRQQRALAVAASVGASRADLFRIVLLQGSVLGLVAGVVGSALGVGLGVVFLHALDDGAASSLWGVHVPWAALIAVTAFAVVVGTLSAIVPARSATKGEVIASLRGARKPVSVDARRPLWGLGLMTVGIALTVASGIWLSIVLASESDEDARLAVGIVGVIVGPVLFQLGVILAGHWIVSLLARVLSRVGLAPRLAGRDAAANPGRVTPAFAAIAACVFLAAIALGSVALMSGQQGRNWTPAAPIGSVALNGYALADDNGVVSERHRLDVVAAERAGRSALEDLGPGRMGTLWRSEFGGAVDQDGTPRDPHVTLTIPARQKYTPCAQGAEVANCVPSDAVNTIEQGTLGVVASDELDTVLGVKLSPGQRAIYDAGGAIALDPQVVDASGKIVLNTFTGEQLHGGRKPQSTTSAPAVTILQKRDDITALVSPETAKKVGGLAPTGWSIIATYDSPVTDAQMDQLRKLIDIDSMRGTVGFGLQLETGPANPAPWMLLIIGATSVLVVGAGGVALGLARFERRADDATLAAVGGGRMLRRNISLWQALVVVGIGSVAGTIAGILPVWGVALASSHIYNPPYLSDLPWGWLALLALGVPLAIAIVSWLVPPRNPDMSRRASIA